MSGALGRVAALVPMVAALVVTAGAGRARANVAPDGLVLAGSTVAENQPAGTVVGTLTALDADPDDPHTFLLVENPGDYFTVDAATGALATAVPLDFESASQRSIRVRATDAGGLWIERSFTITVTDRNDPPTGASLSVAGVPEDAALDALVGTFHAVGDADKTDSWSFVLTDTAEGRFALEGDRLRVAAPLDHESDDLAVIEVVVTDLAGASATTQFVLDIWDRNEPPLGVGLSGPPVPENALPGTSAGTLVPLGDPDANDAWTFALRPTTAPFAVVGDALLALASFDYEARSSYSVPVRVTDRGGRYADSDVVVFVADVGEVPTGVTLAGGGVDENAASGAVAGTLVATDPDAGDSHSFALLSGDGFALTGATLTTTMSFDHEATPVRLLSVKATDLAGHAVTAEVQVPVRDVNEAPTAIALTSASINENSPQNALLGFLSVTDPDVGDHATFVLVNDGDGAFRVENNALRVAANLDHEATPTRTIVVRATDDGGHSLDREIVVTIADVDEAANAVNLDASAVRENQPAGTVVGHLSPGGDPDTTAGYTYALIQNPGTHLALDGDALVTTGPLDYETLRQLNIRVRATAPNGVSVEAQLTIDVLDEPEPPTDVLFSGAVVQESAAPGAFVATLFAQGDPDQNDRHAFTLVENPDDAFAINGSTLAVAKALDFETRDTYPLKIRATDTAGLFVEVPVTVHVLDVNEAPAGVELTPRDIAEDAVVPATVGTLTAVGDPDVGDRFSFSLSQNPEDRFDIIGDQLILRKPVDFEAAVNSYRIQVHVRDAGNLQADSAFYVNVTNVNEAPGALALASRSVAENAPAGTIVDVVTGGVDPDGPDPGTLSITADPAGAFALDAERRLVTTRALDHETEATVSVTVRQTDAGGLYAESTWTIAVDDVDELPQDIALDVASVSEDAEVGSLVGHLSAVGDPDVGDHHTFVISADPDGFFALDGNELHLAKAVDFEAAPSHSVWIQATDAAGQAIERELVVSVVDANDPPTTAETAFALPDVAEDTVQPIGASLTDVFAGLGVNDADVTSTVGLRVTALDEAGGAWWAGSARVAVGDVLHAGPDALRFVPAPDSYGAVELTAVADDGVAASAPVSISEDVTPVDDAPTVTVPELIEGWENAPVAVPIQIDDVDAEVVDVTLTGSHLIIPPALALVTGSVEEVNAALADLELMPEDGYVGDAGLSVTVDDRGGTGAGGPLSDGAAVRVALRSAPDLAVSRDGRELLPGDDEPLGSLGVGAWKTVWLDLLNRGSQELLLTDDVAVTGAWLVVKPAMRLAPGEATRMALMLRPEAAGAQTASVRLTTSDRDPAVYDLSFSGTANLVGDLYVSDLGRTVWNGLPHAIADMRPGRPLQIDFTLENRGMARLELISVEATDLVNAAVDVKDPFPILETDEPGQLEVFVTPVAAGKVGARIVLETDDPDAEQFVFELTGVAEALGAARPVLERLPGTGIAAGGSDDLGVVTSGDEVSVRYLLTNLGQVALDPSTLAVSATKNAEAHVVGSLPETLATGESVEILAFATAAEAGPFDFELTLADWRWTVGGVADATDVVPLRLHPFGSPTTLLDRADLGPLALDEPRVVGFVIENATALPRTLELPVVTSDASGIDAVAAPQPETDLDGFAGAVLPLAVTARAAGPVGFDLHWTASDVVHVTSPGQVGRVVFANFEGAPIDGDTLQLPLLKPGKEVLLSLNIVNGGKGPLTLSDVALDGGAACASVEPPAELVLDPAQSTTVVVHLDPIAGPFQCSLVVTSDAESQPTATLALAARGAANGGGGGCSGGPAAPWLLAGVALWLRRRRRAA
ncbi:MAG: cadherin domain-containing protein [Myxococcota bacterium]